MLDEHLKCIFRNPCHTPWVEIFDSILQFSTVSILIKAIYKCEFILTICCLSDIFSVTLPLSKYFQSEYIDLDPATNKVLHLLQALGEKRSRADQYFTSIILTQARQYPLKVLITHRILEENDKPSYFVSFDVDMKSIFLYLV